MPKSIMIRRYNSTQKQINNNKINYKNIVIYWLYENIFNQKMEKH